MKPASPCSTVTRPARATAAIQIDMHLAYGGVVPELASRDHIRRSFPCLIGVAEAPSAKERHRRDCRHVGPGLAGALLVGASIGHGLGVRARPAGRRVHHWKGHLLSRCLRARHPSFRSSHCWCPADTPNYCRSTPGQITGCWEKRSTMPRARHSTRLRNCSDSGIPVAPLYRASPNSATRCGQTAAADAGTAAT